MPEPPFNKEKRTIILNAISGKADKIIILDFAIISALGVQCDGYAADLDVRSFVFNSRNLSWSDIENAAERDIVLKPEPHIKENAESEYSVLYMLGLGIVKLAGNSKNPEKSFQLLIKQYADSYPFSLISFDAIMGNLLGKDQM